jgi:hypothetical protein
VLLVGLEDGTLALWDARAGGGGGGLAARVEKAHKTRLRAIVPVTPGATGERRPGARSPAAHV